MDMIEDGGFEVVASACWHFVPIRDIITVRKSTSYLSSKLIDWCESFSLSAASVYRENRKWILVWLQLKAGLYCNSYSVVKIHNMFTILISVESNFVCIEHHGRVCENLHLSGQVLCSEERQTRPTTPSRSNQASPTQSMHGHVRRTEGMILSERSGHTSLSEQWGLTHQVHEHFTENR